MSMVTIMTISTPASMTIINPTNKNILKAFPSIRGGFFDVQNVNNEIGILGLLPRHYTFGTETKP
jgi:galactitol-specific phosphotransferase system IIC component